MDLAIPSFLIAIVGIVLQLADAFPEHREARKTIVTMSFGFFAGALANGLSGANYQIKGDLDARYALLFSLIALFVIFALLSAFFTEDKRRESAGNAAWAMFGLFLVTGFVLSIGYIWSTSERSPSLSTDELMVLARNAEARGEFERAINYTQQIKIRLPSSADGEIDNRIEALEKKQLSPQL